MNKITLHHVSGDFWSYLNLEEAYENLGACFLSHNIGPQFKYTQYETYFDHGLKIRIVNLSADFIIRDEKGKEITFSDFKYLDNKKYNFTKKNIVRNTGPIQNTGKRNAYGNLFRKPKTIQEKKLKSLNEIYEYNGKTIAIKSRPKRNVKNLPSSWDDIYRSNIKNDSWKKFRKQQWKDK